MRLVIYMVFSVTVVPMLLFSVVGFCGIRIFLGFSIPLFVLGGDRLYDFGVAGNTL